MVLLNNSFAIEILEFSVNLFPGNTTRFLPHVHQIRYGSFLGLECCFDAKIDHLVTWWEIVDGDKNDVVRSGNIITR